MRARNTARNCEIEVLPKAVRPAPHAAATEALSRGNHMTGQLQDIDARARSEADFHDARIQVVDEDRLGYAYASVADVYEFGAVPPECMDRSVLEVGCFRGEQAGALSGFRGRYVGIDISPAAIDIAVGIITSTRTAIMIGKSLPLVRSQLCPNAFITPSPRATTSG